MLYYYMFTNCLRTVKMFPNFCIFTFIFGKLSEWCSYLSYREENDLNYWMITKSSWFFF